MSCLAFPAVDSRLLLWKMISRRRFKKGFLKLLSPIFFSSQLSALICVLPQSNDRCLFREIKNPSDFLSCKESNLRDNYLKGKSYYQAKDERRYKV